jgi:serine/threonine protein kinase
MEQDAVPEIDQNDAENDGLDSSDAENDTEKNSQQMTTIHRLDLALQAAKALQALHENDVIHADLTAKQFLVLTNELPSAPENGDAGRKTLSPYRLKVNDFNRCRFVPHRTNSTTEKCTIHIPSAPGKPFGNPRYSVR